MSSKPGSTRDTSIWARCWTRSRAPGGLAEAVQVAVRGSTSLSCSLGVSTSKVVCKVASDRRKPGGITVVPPGREARFLAPFAARLLPGVGPRAEERLAAAGIATIGGIAALSDVELRAVLPGQVGRLLRDRACGIDPRDLELDTERSRSRPRRRSSATSRTVPRCTGSSGGWLTTSRRTSVATGSRRAR